MWKLNFLTIQLCFKFCDYFNYIDNTHGHRIQTYWYNDHRRNALSPPLNKLHSIWNFIQNYNNLNPNPILIFKKNMSAQECWVRKKSGLFWRILRKVFRIASWILGIKSFQLFQQTQWTKRFGCFMLLFIRILLWTELKLFHKVIFWTAINIGPFWNKGFRWFWRVEDILQTQLECYVLTSCHNITWQRFSENPHTHPKLHQS